MERAYVFQVATIVMNDKQDFIHHDRTPLNAYVAVIAKNQSEATRLAQIKADSLYPLPELITKKKGFGNELYYKNCQGKVIFNPTKIKNIVASRKDKSFECVILSKFEGFNTLTEEEILYMISKLKENNK